MDKESIEKDSIAIERKKDELYCYNCQARLMTDASYCQSCGQKRAKLRISLRSLVSDFFAQQFSIEGRLFQTLKTLLFRPGQLTIDYCEGKRARYFTPIHLYLVTSVLFFLLLDTASSISPSSAFKVNTDDIRVRMENSPDDQIEVSFGMRHVQMTKQQFIDFLYWDPENLESFFEKNDIPMDPTTMFFAKSSHAIMQPGGAKAFILKYFRIFSQTVLVLMPVFGFIIYGLYWRKSEGAVQCILFSAHVHSFAYVIFILISLIAMIRPIESLFALMSLGIFVYFVWAQRVVFGGYLVANIVKSMVACIVYLFCVFIFVILLLPLVFLTM